MDQAGLEFRRLVVALQAAQATKVVGCLMDCKILAYSTICLTIRDDNIEMHAAEQPPLLYPGNPTASTDRTVCLSTPSSTVSPPKLDSQYLRDSPENVLLCKDNGRDATTVLGDQGIGSVPS
ncbi:uncharacterized protein ATNIH1004_004409 [Aspergillus tanneri]|nr:uncharacterized protein ATNIH1004_004409 [Aspergillus tanneri]KAA8648524.1 hypothetical protein ATNIH1004_004409 [Aspergillus tanneri]